MTNLERLVQRMSNNITQIKRIQENHGPYAQNDRPRAYGFQRSNRPWNTTANNGDVPNPVVNHASKNNQVHKVHIPIVPISNWCRIHSTTTHNETNCPKFKTALNVFHQEMQNMKIVPVDAPHINQPDWLCLPRWPMLKLI